MLEEKHVVTCFLEHRGKICLLKRSSQVGTYKGRWAGVSGYLEKGNAPYQQALEEMREETGLNEGDLVLMKAGEPLEAIDEKLGRKWIIHPFRFRVLSPERLRIDREHTELKWIEPEEIGDFETVPRLAETWERVK